MVKRPAGLTGPTIEINVSTVKSVSLFLKNYLSNIPATAISQLTEIMDQICAAMK